MKKVIRLTESDLGFVIKQIISESIKLNDIINANNKMKGMSDFIIKRLEGKGLVIEKNSIQPWINLYVDEMNKKSRQIYDLINQNKPVEYISQIYISTFISFFHQKFAEEFNWAKKKLVRHTVETEKMESYFGGIWQIPIQVMYAAVDSLPIDEIKKEKIKKNMFNKKFTFSTDLVNYAMKEIYG